MLAGLQPHYSVRTLADVARISEHGAGTRSLSRQLRRAQGQSPSAARGFPSIPEQEPSQVTGQILSSRDDQPQRSGQATGRPGPPPPLVSPGRAAGDQRCAPIGSPTSGLRPFFLCLLPGSAVSNHLRPLRREREVRGGDAGLEIRTECWLIMEYCDVGSLEDELDSMTALWDLSGPNWSIFLEVALSVAKGLRFLHGRDMFHGNLKASNVLFGEKGCELQVKLADICFDPEPRPDTVSQYAAPEKRQSERSDIYSFGVLLWEMLHAPAITQAGLRPSKRSDLRVSLPGAEGAVSARTGTSGAKTGLLGRALSRAVGLKATGGLYDGLGFPGVSKDVGGCPARLARLVAACCSSHPEVSARATATAASVHRVASWIPCRSARRSARCCGSSSRSRTR